MKFEPHVRLKKRAPGDGFDPHRRHDSVHESDFDFELGRQHQHPPARFLSFHLPHFKFAPDGAIEGDEDGAQQKQW